MTRAGAIVLFLLLLAAAGAPAAAQNTWAGNSAEDMAEEQEACWGDANRFCGGNTLLVFEMENCLKRHLRRLSKPCRALLAPTDFRKYHRRESFPFEGL